MFIAHASLPADEPERTARVLAEIMGGEALPFPPGGQAMWMAWAGDGQIELEIAPRGVGMEPGKDGANWSHANGSPRRSSECHLAISVDRPADEIMAIARRAGWPTARYSRGDFFLRRGGLGRGRVPDRVPRSGRDRGLQAQYGARQLEDRLRISAGIGGLCACPISSASASAWRPARLARSARRSFPSPCCWPATTFCARCAMRSPRLWARIPSSTSAARSFLPCSSSCRSSAGWWSGFRVPGWCPPCMLFSSPTWEYLPSPSHATQAPESRPPGGQARSTSGSRYSIFLPSPSSGAAWPRCGANRRDAATSA